MGWERDGYGVWEAHRHSEGPRWPALRGTFPTSHAQVLFSRATSQISSHVLRFLFVSYIFMNVSTKKTDPSETGGLL